LCEAGEAALPAIEEAVEPEAEAITQGLAQLGEGSEALIQELEQLSLKFTRPSIISIVRAPSGKVVWLEKGTEESGLQHILEGHAQDFANKGIPAADIPDVIMNAITRGTVVGPSGANGVVYETVVGGQRLYLLVVTGNNGYIVTSHPISWP
jgi:filamentous hemagglutinin